MGYILNRCDMLNNLRQEMSTERYKQIKLTAIIVHDPKDKEFCEYVREKFLMLARMTGEHFLFVTFIQPKDSWEAIQNRMGVYPSQYMVFDPSCNEDIENTVSPLLRVQLML